MRGEAPCFPDVMVDYSLLRINGRLQRRDGFLEKMSSYAARALLYQLVDGGTGYVFFWS